MFFPLLYFFTCNRLNGGEVIKFFFLDKIKEEKLKNTCCWYTLFTASLSFTLPIQRTLLLPAGILKSKKIILLIHAAGNTRAT